MSNFDSSSYNPNAGSSIPKILNPGSHILAIREIAIDYPPYNPSAIFLQFLVESQPVSDDSFEGILKDKQDPSKGSWAGQIARVKSGRFPFSTFTYNGRVVERDAQIFRFIMKLVEQLNVLDLVQKADIKADTIEDYVTKVAPFLTNKWAFFTLGGMEYYTEGYDRPNYRLFFPKATKTEFPYSALKDENSKVIKFLKFSEAEHIVAAKPEDTPGGTATSSAPVSGFEAGMQAPAAPQPAGQPGFGQQAPAPAPSSGELFGNPAAQNNAFNPNPNPAPAAAPAPAPAPAAAPAPQTTGQAVADALTERADEFTLPF